MNDSVIRKNFHFKKLQSQHADKNTLVIEELGLNHGKNRADIAVLNGRFIGYEIKSDNDSLRRLRGQIESYNAIFDQVYIVVGERYTDTIQEHLPPWWGVIKVVNNKNNNVDFKIIRKAQTNKYIEPISIARLLWRDEALEVLKQKKTPRKILREPRDVLYQYMADTFDISEIKKTVRIFLKKRENWRYPKAL